MQGEKLLKIYICVLSIAGVQLMNELERAESVEGERESGGKRLHYSKVDTSDETDYDSNIV